MKKGGGKTGLSVRMNLSDAPSVLEYFNWNEKYLQDIIDKYIPVNVRESVDEMSYKRLRYFGHVIKGVAEKMIKEKNSKKIRLEQLSLFS